MPRLERLQREYAEALWEDAIFGTEWPERPARRRFDPRRLTDRLRRMPPPIVPAQSGKVIYSSTARPEDLYTNEGEQ